MSPALLAVGRRPYVSLTTLRRAGAGVATPVWIAPVDGDLVVLTGSASGKVKRLRRDPRVELAPCDRRGRVRPGAPTVHGLAEIVTDAAEQHRLLGGHRREYGVPFRLLRVIRSLLSPGGGGEVVLRIRDA